MRYAAAEAPDCLACDTSYGVGLLPSQARILHATSLAIPAGSAPRPIRGVAQYVRRRRGVQSAGDITIGRLPMILSAGLGLWLVQHVAMPGWVASAQLGADLGGAAAEHAIEVGYLRTCHLGVDQEGCASVGRPVADFLEAWAAEVIKVRAPAPTPAFGEVTIPEAQVEEIGYRPLVYDGFAAGLTPDQLYAWLPRVHLYWSDYGPRQVSHRGFAVKQHAQQTLPGLPFAVDVDEVGSDQLGGRLRWMVDLDAYGEVA